MSAPDLDNIEPHRLAELMARSRDFRDHEPAPQPVQVEGYEILGRLGEGASGTVWRARQSATGRKVALKLLHPSGVGSFRARQRFEREIELTARLSHPNIARLYDSGARRGAWFYAMELIDGLPLDRYVAEQRLGKRQILLLIAQVARAIQHAHQSGIIHRDLKPSNILVSADGQPHVLDFGLARATAEVPQGLTFSVAGEVAGTLAFMSPEQAAGRSDAIDTRSDVYSLGAILFLLLTGNPPHDLSGSGLDVLRRIAEQEFTLPRRREGLDAELETVLLKALAHEPGRRYASAGALADDIERYLKGDPLTARAPTLAYWVGRRVRKHRLALAAAVVACGALLSMAVYAYVRIAHERNIALQKSAYALDEQKLALAAQRLAENRLADALLAQGNAMAEAGRWLRAKELYRDSWKKLLIQHRPTFPVEAALLRAYEVAPPPLARYALSSRPLRATAFGPDGRLAACGGDDGLLRVWDVRTGRVLNAFTDHAGSIRSIAFSPDGRRVVSGDDAATLIVHDLATGRTVWRQTYGNRIDSVAWSPDRKWVVSCGFGTPPIIWGADSGEKQAVLGDSKGCHSATFSPDSRRCFVSDGGLFAWEVPTGRRWGDWFGDDFCTAVVLPDGRRILSGDGAPKSGPGKLKLWDSSSNGVLFSSGTIGPVNTVAVSSDGKRGYSAGDGVVRAWDLAGGRLLATFWVDDGPLSGVALLPDRQLALSAGTDGTVSLCDLGASREDDAHVFPSPLSFVTVAPDDQRVVVGGKSLAAITGADCVPSGTLEGVAGTLQVAAVSPDGKLVLCGSSEGQVSLFRADTARKVITLGRHEADVRTVLFSPDGAIAVTANGSEAALWDMRTCKCIHRVRPGATLAPGGAFVDAGRRVMGMNVHGQVVGFDLVAKREIEGRFMDAPAQITSNCVYVERGRKVVGACGSTVFLWDVGTGRRLATFAGHVDDVTAIAVSPDERWLASGGNDYTVRIWNLAGGSELQEFDRHTAPVKSLAFSHDGQRLYSAGEDGQLRCLDFSRPQRYRDFEGRLAEAGRVLQVSPDDPQARATLARWYSFRHRDDWAADLRGEGTAPPPQ